ncbi:MAG: hypothetical protein J5784_02720 [Muribaculaceae bacterium]|nr:hypothetical protein [Muribaculaceae bacterium]MBR4722847.1 hypothetical protein [Muribaculaceae bacterium]
MKKFTLSMLALATVVGMQAGGLMTNTNHGAAFLRDMARGTTLAVDAVYFNPAGTAFMSEGIHWGFNEQVAIQDRVTTSTFAPFALYEKGNGATTLEFKGKTFSPIIPSVDFVWKKNKLALMGSVSVGGGGGSLEFKDGLSDYVAQFGLGTQKVVPGGKYNMDMYLKGTSITASVQFGAAYKLTDRFAVAAQIRSNIGYAKYDGHVRDITVNEIPLAKVNPAFADRELDAKQTGVAFSPNFAVSYNDGAWSYTGKYEFKSAIKLKNNTKVDEFGLFPDGEKVDAEMPALLTQAISYRFGRNLGYLKLTGEWHHFFDTDAKNSFTKAEESGSNEYLFGAEVYASPKLELSAAYQRTVFSLNPDAHSELNYNMNSHSVGFGGAYAFNQKLKLNLGCMMTFYDAVNSTQVNFLGSGLDKQNKYDRHNVTLGVGLEYNF